MIEMARSDHEIEGEQNLPITTPKPLALSGIDHSPNRDIAKAVGLAWLVSLSLDAEGTLTPNTGEGKSVIVNSPDSVYALPPFLMASHCKHPVPADFADFMLHSGLLSAFLTSPSSQNK